jgi:uncharacterized protein with gpF-like domain
MSSMFLNTRIWSSPVMPREPNINDRYQRPYGMPRPAPTAVTGAMDRAPATKPRRQRSRAGSRPNAALEALYRKRLERLVTEMAESVLYWTKAAYRANPPIMAMDRTPADYLRAAFAKLRKRWEDRFDAAAGKLARWFAQSAATRSDAVLKRILKDGGLSVRFTPTKAMRDVMEGTVQANVALIKSIPEKYLTQVEGIVFRSVQTGRDLHQLSNDLRHEFGVTKRRAATIALSQNNMATSAMTRARQMELSLQAVWIHSHAGKTPRKTHLANDGQPYSPELGWFDPDPKVRKRIWPGQLPGCRCFSRTLIPGFKP